MKKVFLYFMALIVSLSMISCEKEEIKPNPCEDEFLVYSALITQTGSSDPTVSILGSNTVGNVEWKTTMAGIYFGTLPGSFTGGKTIVDITENGSNSMTFRIDRSSDDHVVIVTKDAGQFSNGLLYETPIEIKVLK